MNNEQLTVNNDKKEQRYLVSLLLLFILHCSLFIGCDLFNSSAQDDHLAKIDDEIAWANAKKLTVTIAYPGTWGTSNPPAGEINRSVIDIRQGYAFELEFTPDIAYAFQGWRAYATEALKPEVLGGNWMVDPTLLEEKLPDGVTAKVPQLSGVEIPSLPARGGTGKFTINNPMPVTLVPWCKTEPYVIRTDPRSEDRNSDSVRRYPPSTPVTFYFNAALNPEMPWDKALENGMVEIKERHVNDIKTNAGFTDCNELFDRVVYDNRAGQYTVTVYPKTGVDEGPQAHSQIEITVAEIQNIQGELMSKPEVFYYQILPIEGVDAYVTGWSAAYDENTVSVTCDIGGTNAEKDGENDIITFTAYYQMNQGSDQLFELTRSGDSNTFTGTIGNVGALDVSGVLNGRGVGNIREYGIFMVLNAGAYIVDDVDFIIWNFPGMSVSKTNPVTEISRSSGLTVEDLTGQYVLAEDITISNHTPIGTGDAPFTGKFYGNGHTVTINGINAADMGLFGVADNAIIRDLTVRTVSDVTSVGGIARQGGIAGQAQGTTQILNCTVSGDLRVTSSHDINAGGMVGIMEGATRISNCTISGDLRVTSSHDVYAGGMVGIMEATTQIENCHSGINLYVTENGNGAIRIGGIAGQITKNNDTDGSGNTMMNGVRAAGNVTANNSEGNIYLGGVVGESLGLGTMEEINVSGTLSMSATSIDSPDTLYICGGIIGRMQDGNLFLGDFNGKITIPSSHAAAGETLIGGIVGVAGKSRGFVDNTAKVTVISATARGDMDLKIYCSGDITLGGIFAASEGAGKDDEIVFQNCEYRDGSILVDSTNSTGGYIGGFAGDIGPYTETIRGKTSAKLIKVVYAPGLVVTKNIGGINDIDVDVNSNITTVEHDGLMVGGFVGKTISSLEELYSNSQIEVDIRNFQDVVLRVGGFVGFLEAGGNGRISRCFAKGSVTVNAGHTGKTSIRTGGFGGYVKGNVQMENSYALGAVLVHKNYPSAAIGVLFTGGFIGATEYNRNAINCCFSAGTVMSLFNGNELNALNFAGGIVGHSQSNVQRNVALGAFVSAQGGGYGGISVVGGRVYGHVTTQDGGIQSGPNYAYNLMRQYNSNTYGTDQPTSLAIDDIIHSYNRHGEHVYASSGTPLLTNESFWTGVGFNRSTWDYSGLNIRHYPLLIGMGDGGGSGTAPAITTARLPDGTGGTPYSHILEARGDTPIRWSIIDSDALPAGLSLAATGLISGTPTTTGTSTFTVRAENGAGYDIKEVSITIITPNTPVITTATLPDGMVGRAYSQTLVAIGITPITWSLDSGTLPTGLSLDGETGVIAGTPSTPGTSGFTVKAANSAGSYTRQFSITIINNPLITTATLPDGIAGAAYSGTLAAIGDTPITWSLDSGTLPTGLSLAENGTISGTPTTAGTSGFTIKAVNSVGSDTKQFSITININITTATLPDGMVGRAYSGTLAATGSTSITWSIDSGTLPTGLSLAPTGVIAGTPATAGTSGFTVKATDSTGSDTKQFSITIIKNPLITNPATLPKGMEGTAYSWTITAIGDTPITWSLDSGTLPAGLNLATTGTISGTPTTAGTSTITVKVVNSIGSDTKQFSITIVPTIEAFEMVQIQGGTFTMGSPSGESGRQPNETQHDVTLTGFSMGKYQVTQALYQSVMGTNPSYFTTPVSPETSTANRPVDRVSWYDAIVFCNTLSILTGLSPAYEMRTEADTNVWSTEPTTWGTVPTDTNTRWNEVRTKTGSTGYRLPTEAQWEYACRAGTTTAYNTGPTIDNNTGWFANVFGVGQRTHTVGEKPANAWGLYDMHGNVNEWCWDWYAVYREEAQIDPTGADTGTSRVNRGGSFNSTSGRSAGRGFGSNPYNRDSQIGFRIVRP